MKETVKQKILKQKREALKRLGIEPPKNSIENRERAKAAHGY
jgi:hypothetical protein